MRAALRAAAERPAAPFVFTALRAAAERPAALRFRAAFLACVESAFRVVAERPSRLSACVVARERRRDTACLRFGLP